MGARVMNRYCSPEWKLYIEFDYTPYQPQHRDCPEQDAEATLTEVKLFGIDITDAALKDAAWVAIVEGEHVEEMQERASSNSYE